ncbi:AfsR/SARP family transcriptional regulator [Streptomyces sp. NBC_00503]|uniref:AfsR/SARP family transcriptional regulator n=1 Tax=Streptomyces sp. NBC_00503 TaxID=2903659 RepID=UPI002E8221AF|nr:AfsR/SARP family transcriptional regulator [Streptomyces sp. NBC_00503]WUD86489.1 AfsR/SARP family transcriptional regulator [Streptomyces sp. NBC_00503]
MSTPSGIPAEAPTEVPAEAPAVEPWVRIGVLGPLSLVVDGEDRTPSAPKPRQLLALLMLNANQMVRAGECITELWGSHPPKTALSTLQTYVLYIRQILRGGATDRSCSLITRNQSYQLGVAPEASDRLRFENLARLGREAVATGDPVRASRLFGEALEQWRGPALADVPAGAVGSPHVVELEEARKGVREWRVEVDLQLGRHRELLTELAGLSAQHPTHENIHAQYMLALHRSGLRPEALGVFQRLRCRLGDHFGIEPVPRLRRLYEAIDADDPVLRAPAGALHAT